MQGFNVNLLRKGSVLNDSIWQIGGAIVNRASYFVTLVMLSSILSPNDYGVFGLLYSLANSIASINSSTLGIPARRELVRLSSPIEGGGSILKINLLLIALLTGGILFVTSIYYDINEDDAYRFSRMSLMHVFHLSCNLSISHYLSYHFGGVGKFAAYNKLLLPVNIVLPFCVFIFPPKTTNFSIVLISGVTLIGNLVQVIHLIKHNSGSSKYHLNGFSFVKRNYRAFISCFVQSLLGLPVFLLLQLTITVRWQDFVLIGVITLATQLLNISNIFATRMLTVLSPRISKTYVVSKNIPFSYFLRLLGVYSVVIIVISLFILLILPFLLELTESNFINQLKSIRYFMLVNILSCLVWFLQEYFHAISQSLMSLYTNIIFSVSLLALFFCFYYWYNSFDLFDYANCIAFARICTIIISIPLLVRYGKISKNSI